MTPAESVHLQPQFLKGGCNQPEWSVVTCKPGVPLIWLWVLNMSFCVSAASLSEGEGHLIATQLQAVCNMK